jgi:hypothetical protein
MQYTRLERRLSSGVKNPMGGGDGSLRHNKKHNKPRRDNHYQPFSFDDFQ